MPNYDQVVKFLLFLVFVNIFFLSLVVGLVEGFSRVNPWVEITHPTLVSVLVLAGVSFLIQRAVDGESS